MTAFTVRLSSTTSKRARSFVYASAAWVAVCAVCVWMLLLPAHVHATETGVAQMDLPRTQLRVGNKARMDVQLATTFHQRQIGLMHRTSMPADEGMLLFSRTGHAMLLDEKHAPAADRGICGG